MGPDVMRDLHPPTVLEGNDTCHARAFRQGCASGRMRSVASRHWKGSGESGGRQGENGQLLASFYFPWKRCNYKPINGGHGMNEMRAVVGPLPAGGATGQKEKESGESTDIQLKERRKSIWEETSGQRREEVAAAPAPVTSNTLARSR
jgi:hypothetical protein